MEQRQNVPASPERCTVCQEDVGRVHTMRRFNPLTLTSLLYALAFMGGTCQGTTIIRLKRGTAESVGLGRPTVYQLASVGGWTQGGAAHAGNRASSWPPLNATLINIYTPHTQAEPCEASAGLGAAINPVPQSIVRDGPFSIMQLASVLRLQLRTDWTGPGRAR
uniref:Uncharacterized protein n=1 Tax=Eutreptiella gymnastica TaxID=73025 RepID=A0A7S1NTR4_9EUGL